MKYRVYLSTKVSPAKLEKGPGIIVIEPDDYTATQVKAIKAKGYKVLGYLSVGTVEKERTWWKKYKKYSLKKLEDWPDENYADLTKKVWADFLVARAKTLKKKGFDGWWCDNIDVCEYYPTEKMYTSCVSILKRIKAIGGYVMINGGSRFLKKCESGSIDPKGFIDGYTQEEVFSRITSYRGKGKFNRQYKEEAEYYKEIIKIANERKIQTFLLEYTRDEAVKEDIRAYYKEKSCTGYYISGDVNL